MWKVRSFSPSLHSCVALSSLSSLSALPRRSFLPCSYPSIHFSRLSSCAFSSHSSFSSQGVLFRTKRPNLHKRFYSTDKDKDKDKEDGSETNQNTEETKNDGDGEITPEERQYQEYLKKKRMMEEEELPQKFREAYLRDKKQREERDKEREKYPTPEEDSVAEEYDRLMEWVSQKKKKEEEKERKKAEERAKVEQELEKEKEAFDKSMELYDKFYGIPSLGVFFSRIFLWGGLLGSVFLLFYLLGPPRQTLTVKEFFDALLKPKNVKEIRHLEKGSVIIDKQGNRHFLYTPSPEIFQKRIDYMEYLYEYDDKELVSTRFDNTPEIRRERTYKFFQYFLWVIVGSMFYFNRNLVRAAPHLIPQGGFKDPRFREPGFMKRNGDPFGDRKKDDENLSEEERRRRQQEEDEDDEESEDNPTFKPENDRVKKPKNEKEKEKPKSFLQRILQKTDALRQPTQQSKDPSLNSKNLGKEEAENRAKDDEETKAKKDESQEKEDEEDDEDDEEDQSQAKASKPQVKFSDVAGLDEAKMEVMEFVDFLKHPQKYRDLGAKTPKGALLVGPPGCGKTLLAKAIAGEAGVPFYNVPASSFVEVFVGVGAQKVRKLFKHARTRQPAIIFIDEIDAIGSKRQRSGNAANEEREGTLNQLLVEMDGFDSSAEIIVLAGTNRAEVLDDALTRPGRFDRQIEIGKPPFRARKEIFSIYLKKLVLESKDRVPDYCEKLALFTPGFTGAEIAQVCNEAALLAARADKNAVQLDDLDKAIDKTVAGLERKSLHLSAETKRKVAFHEAGHAIVGWFSKHAEPLMKASIVPRGVSALGFTSYIPKESYISTHEQLFDTMCVMLGGRVAEEIEFGEITTGASDDLSRLTRLAYQKILRYGMSHRVGPVGLSQETGGEFMSRRVYSEATAELVDEEVRTLIEAAHKATTDLLREHKDALEKVATHLLEKEVLSYDEVVSLIGERPIGRTLNDTLQYELARHAKFEQEIQKITEKEKVMHQKEQIKEDKLNLLKEQEEFVKEKVQGTRKREQELQQDEKEIAERESKDREEEEEEEEEEKEKEKEKKK